MSCAPSSLISYFPIRKDVKTVPSVLPGSYLYSWRSAGASWYEFERKTEKTTFWRANRQILPLRVYLYGCATTVIRIE